MYVHTYKIHLHVTGLRNSDIPTALREVSIIIRWTANNTVHCLYLTTAAYSRRSLSGIVEHVEAVQTCGEYMNCTCVCIKVFIIIVGDTLL